MPRPTAQPVLPCIDVDNAASDEDDEAPIFSGSYVPDVASPSPGEEAAEEEAPGAMPSPETAEQKRIASMQAIVDASREAGGRRPIHGDQHTLTKEEEVAFGRAKALWDGKRRRRDMLEVGACHRNSGRRHGSNGLFF